MCEYAIFADGSRKRLIKYDAKYGKYFEVDNELNDECTSVLRFSFTDRVKDAVDIIRSGDGDCIQSMNLFGQVDRVLYFLDRKVGERFRQLILDGWKDAKFEWAIKCEYKNSMSGYVMLNNKNERISHLNKERVPVTFETKEKANEYTEYLVGKARYYTKRLVNNISDISDKDEREKIIKAAIDEIEEETKTKFSVVMDFMLDMITDDIKIKNKDCSLDEMGYRIIQYAVLD